MNNINLNRSSHFIYSSQPNTDYMHNATSKYTIICKE